ncbi:MAG: radical SAM protein [Deltaproteobacteria bacterium]|nr:radical SAM protein [Deltaproteobacteria bacterium]
MRPLPSLRAAAARTVTQLTGRAHSLPMLVILPHEGCNAKCVMCDIWKTNPRGVELPLERIDTLLPELQGLSTERIVLSGGEALLHSEFEALARRLASAGAKLTLLSTGLTLARNAPLVAELFDEIVVSLDGPELVHDQIRRVPRAFEKLRGGVAALKAQRSELRVTARSVVQRLNHHLLEATIDAARSLGLDAISFLAFDGTSDAFARTPGLAAETPSADQLTPTPEESRSLLRLIGHLEASRPELFASRFVTESPDKLRRIPRLFLALHGLGEFPQPRCNAPWVSAVVEANGDVRPCFFHRPIGSLTKGSLTEVLSSPRAVAFRRRLDVATDPTCRRCVCSLELGPFGRP